jgi:hypothetical protein
MEGTLLFTSLVYEKEVGLQLASPLTVVRPDPSELGYPYGDMDACNPGQTLWGYCFESYWGADGVADHDLMHFFTGQDFLSQLGYIGFASGKPCLPSSGNGYYQKWGISNGTTSPVYGVTLMAHELGHNLYLNHISDGAIMNPGLASATYFSPVHLTQLQNRIVILQNSGCINDFGSPTVAPTLSSVSPSAVQAKAGEIVTLYGQNLDFVVEVEFAGQRYGLPVLNRVSDTELRFTLKSPPGEFLGVQDVVVRTGGGEDSIPLTLAAVSPIQMEAFSFFTFAMGMAVYSGAGDAVALGWGLSPAVIDFGGWSILADWTSIDVVTLNSIGHLINYTWYASPSLIGQTVYLQAIGTDGTNRSSTVPQGVLFQ